MFETRIRSIQDILPDHEIDAFLITSTYNISYLSGILNFSIEEREARILITKQNCYFFTDARYTEMVKEKAPHVTLIEISSTSPLLKWLKKIIIKEDIKGLGFEQDNITYKEALELEEKISIEMVPTDGIVEEIRMIKDNDETTSIKRACSLTDSAFEFILRHLKPGVTELEIQKNLDSFIRDNGGEVSFPSIVAFGKNSAIPHHMPTQVSLQKSDIVLLDFGAKVNGYCSDMTRTVFLNTRDEILVKMYRTNLEAQEIAIDYLKTHMKRGFDTQKVQELANSHLRQEGYSDIPHAAGHGVGLQVHELPTLSPISDDKIQPGMVITVEPGIYIPGLGGVRIEDTVLITTDGIEILTKSTKELLILSS